MADTPKRVRALPKIRKAWGTSANVDGEVMVYTETEMTEFADVCFQDGYRAAMRQIEDALRAAGVWSASKVQQQHPIQAEEDAWGDFQAGRGPHPGRR